MDNIRILVSGDVCGNFNQFFQRINNVINKSGQFDIVLCVGNFFPLDNNLIDDCQKNLIEICENFFKKNNLNVYILGPINESQVAYYKLFYEENSNLQFEHGFEICNGITYLGKKGVLNTIKGLKVAYLSGDEGTCSQFCFNEEDVNDLIESCKANIIDILITYSYPLGVRNFSLQDKNDSHENGSILISKLSYSIQPRYHFCANTNLFYEREPYRNHLVIQEKLKQMTRFISLAKVNNINKEKWLYAFNIKSSKVLNFDELTKQSENVTENPYSKLDFNQKNFKNKENTSFFYDLSRSNKNNHKVITNSLKKSHSENEDEKDIKKSKSEPSDCWFCLASPQVEKHLIISIGEHCYLALAKGGLVDYNLLILPIGHYRSLLQINNDESLKEVSNEIGLFKNAIVDYFRNLNLVPVFFERNFRSNHLQLQIIPIETCKKENLKNVLNEMCIQRNLKLNEVPKNLNFNEVLSDNIPYFYIEAFGERFFIRIKASKGFPMQFGREILAHEEILNLPSKVDWRNCELDLEKSKSLVEKIRNEFKEFDFTLDT